MEKIYEEKFGDSKRSHNKFNFSIILSFIVAAFAIVSLIAVGFDQISFAAPISNNDNFTFYLPESDGNTYGARANLDESVGTGNYYVPFYQADSSVFGDENAIPLFCLEHNASAVTDQSYIKDRVVTDNGLIYILNKSATLGGIGIVNKGEAGYSSSEYDIVERYATQVAIWVYLYETQGSNAKNSLAVDPLTSEDAIDVLTKASYLTITGDESIDDIALPAFNSGTISFFEYYIRPVINQAKVNGPLKSITITGDSKISKVGDDDFYQTEKLSLICENCQDDLLNYTVTLSGIDGAFVVDENGNDKTNSTFNPSDSFYVRIPVQNVTEESRIVTISVYGVVDNYLVGSEYISTNGDFQKVVAIVGNQHELPAVREIQVVGSPDTGMNKAQTIYFIGLIVLLCGVGIIYANAKPVETE